MTMPPSDAVLPRRGAYRALPFTGLHLLGDRFRLAYTAEHARQLLDRLDEYIRLTDAAAPVRRHRAYKLTETKRLFRRRGETEWERALWAEYHTNAPLQALA